jgi:hypothetical protein
MKSLPRFSASFLMTIWTCGAFAATATGSFNHDFVSDSACSTTIAADCVDHFESAGWNGVPYQQSSPI